MESTVKTFIGIDVSKATLDICLLDGNSKKHLTIDNKVRAISTFLKKLKGVEVVIGVENTGRYNWPLYEALAGYPMTTHVIPPLHLKKSLGLSRGKNDKVDAERIAQFTQRHQKELSPWQPPTKQVQQLKVLLTERNHRIKVKKQLLKMKHDYGLMKNLELNEQMEAMNEELTCKVDEQIIQLEKQIEDLLRSDEQMALQARLIRSVPGVGKVLSWYLIAKTSGFRDITEPRKMACYCGVVPFDHQSGSSVKWKQRVSVYADKMLKSLLHLGAMSAIRLDNDLRAYYLRKVAEGKNKMSVLNAVRNKILHRIYAVIKNQRLYQPNLIMS